MADNTQIVISRDGGGLSSSAIPGVGVSHLLMFHSGEIQAELMLQANGLPERVPMIGAGSHGSNAPLAIGSVSLNGAGSFMPACCSRAVLPNEPDMDFPAVQVPSWDPAARISMSGPPIH